MSMSKNPAIIVNQLTKQYELGQIREDSLKHTLENWIRGKRGNSDKKKFLALDNISLTIEQGEVVGILGHNGAGKSTFLKVLARITQPSSGYAEVYGRVGTLLEIGTGFHPDLTGMENIYLNGAILGMKEKEIKSKLDEIIAFSGIEQFIYTPVKYYSSGMTVRLAFSVASHLEADIIFLDEIWGAGDLDFSKKSIKKMKEMVKSGKTVLIISHDLKILSDLSTRCLWMKKGQIIRDGTPKEVIYDYKKEQNLPANSL
ncbi:MAG: ABC transporter ATP-binding protein [Alphaproteobacteria bacterium]|jgi:lipopolysaccharide transport system ATP-binding protein|nr:ABC transporter ATP-binding protein [Alphaproteobacteria bacterium]